MKIKNLIYTTIVFLFFSSVLIAQNKFIIPRDTINYPALRSQLTTLNQDIKSDSTNCTLFFKRNLLHFELAQITKAKNDLDKVIKLCPNDTLSYFYYYQRGSLNDKLGLKKEAYKDFSKSVKLKPDFAGGYLDRGAMLTNIGYLKEGKIDIELALKLKPNWGDAYFALGLNYDYSKDKDNAIINYLKTIEYKAEKDSFVHLAYNNIGAIYNQKGKCLEAIPFFEKALEIKENYITPLTNRAESNFRLGNKKEACQDLQKAISLGRDDLKSDYNYFCN